MKFAVTGGAGFIGSNIVKLLINNGHSVRVIDNLHTGKLKNLSGYNDKFEFKHIDIRNINELKKAFEDIDGVFHQAALTIVQESFDNPSEYYEVNVEGTKNVFNVANDFDLKVIFASSSSVYGNIEKFPIQENFHKNPINPYGKTKLEKEKLAENFCKKKSRIIGLRYFNVFGEGQTGNYAGVITKFLNNIKNNEPLKINGDGKQIRDFIHVFDVAKINLVAMQSNITSGFFNVGTGIGTSINDLALMMNKIGSQKNEILHGESLKGDVKISLADMKLTKKLLNWNYEKNLEEGLKELLQNY